MFYVEIIDKARMTCSFGKSNIWFGTAGQTPPLCNTAASHVGPSAEFELSLILRSLYTDLWNNVQKDWRLKALHMILKRNSITKVIPNFPNASDLCTGISVKHVSQLPGGKLSLSFKSHFSSYQLKIVNHNLFQIYPLLKTKYSVSTILTGSYQNMNLIQVKCFPGKSWLTLQRLIWSGRVQHMLMTVCKDSLLAHLTSLFMCSLHTNVHGHVSHVFLLERQKEVCLPA